MARVSRSLEFWSSRLVAWSCTSEFVNLRSDTYLKRFYSKIKATPSGCWEWQGYRAIDGYGKSGHKGETLAHRISFALFIGPLFKKMCVLHRCDNPPCVNPAHLFIGDRDVNNKDRKSKGRTVTINQLKTHCPVGHEYTVLNTYVRPNGSRKCRQCNALRERRK